MVLGDFDFLAMNQAHRVLGPVYFFSYIFLVFFILMVGWTQFLVIHQRGKSAIFSYFVIYLQNMFMAIINDTYSEVKTEVEARKEDFQMGDFVMRGYNNVRGEVADWLCEPHGLWKKRTMELKHFFWF